MDIRFQSNVLFVADIARSKAFYTDLLGQKVLMDHGLNVGFAGFALWQAGHVEEVMGVSTRVGDQPLGRHNLELYFESNDVAGVAAQLAEADVPLLHPVIEQPWGQRTVRFFDPDGHIVEVGEPMPAVIARFHQAGLTPEEIARRTAMPVEVVTAILGGISSDTTP